VKRFGPDVRKTRKPLDPEWVRFMSTEEKESQRLAEWLKTSLADTGLPVRAVNCLEEKDILTVQDLANQSNDDLLGVVNFGTQTLEQCRRLLVSIGVPHNLV
jgi:DNA-directed RNA polymerase alpha subunit|tara:strand:+ start:2310 stop:2615 length:306 start_codon:yes stop_codon:yes gene_type:complete